MPRFKDRMPQWWEMFGRFEAQSSSLHFRNACAFINRLSDDGSHFWLEGSQQLIRWREYCKDLLEFLYSLESRRNSEKQGLETALREFFQVFEHSTAGMHEMMYGTGKDPDNDEDIKVTLDWFDIAFRLSVHALVSGWIDDKTEENHVEITVNLTTGERTDEWTRSEMKLPRKYRSRAKKP